MLLIVKGFTLPLALFLVQVMMQFRVLWFVEVLTLLVRRSIGAGRRALAFRGVVLFLVSVMIQFWVLLIVEALTLLLVQVRMRFHAFLIVELFVQVRVLSRGCSACS